MAVRGTEIEGWWAWFTRGDARTARRFKTKEAALEWQPNPKGMAWLGQKMVMRVSIQPAKRLREHHPWSYDPPERFPGPETESQAYHRVARELTKK
jgi:hypothetical protein